MRKPLRLEWRCDCGYALSVQAYPSRHNPGDYEPVFDRVICNCDRSFRVSVTKNPETCKHEIHVKDVGVVQTT